MTNEATSRPPTSEVPAAKEQTATTAPAVEKAATAPGVPKVTRRRLGRIGGPDSKGIAYAEIIVPLRVPHADGSVEYLEVPVRPLSCQERDELMQSERPVPPSHRMPMSDGVVRVVYNETDPGYVKALQAWMTKRGWALVAMSIGVEMQTPDGRPAVSVEDRIAAVQSLGLSTEHFIGLTAAAAQATKARSEELLDFSGLGSAMNAEGSPDGR